MYEYFDFDWAILYSSSHSAVDLVQCLSRLIDSKMSCCWGCSPTPQHQPSSPVFDKQYLMFTCCTVCFFPQTMHHQLKISISTLVTTVNQNWLVIYFAAIFCLKCFIPVCLCCLLLLFSFSFDSPSPVPVTWSSTWRVSGFLVLVNLPLSLRLTSSMSHFSTTAKTSCLRGALLSCGRSGLPQSTNVSHSTCDRRSSVPDFCLLVFLSTSCRHTNRDKTLSMYRGKKNFSCTWYAKESFSSTAM